MPRARSRPEPSSVRLLQLQSPFAENSVIAWFIASAAGARRAASFHSPRRGQSSAAANFAIWPYRVGAPVKQNTAISSRGGKRGPALDDVAQHQFQFALQRIAPAAAAGRHHANDLLFQHGLAIDETAKGTTFADRE